MSVRFVDLGRANRLKSERKKFEGLTQKAAAEIADVSEQSWVRFEKRGEAFDLNVMQRLEDFGFDMMFVIFGIPRTLEPDQQELIRLYSHADENQKAKILQMIDLMTQSD